MDYEVDRSELQSRHPRTVLRGWDGNLLAVVGTVMLIDVTVPTRGEGLEPEIQQALKSEGLDRASYIPMIQVGLPYRGRKLGLDMLLRLRAEAQEQWPGLPLTAACVESLKGHWSRAGAVFTGTLVRQYHFFRIDSGGPSD